eukprot:4664307-Pyramimonas_sp.AAC.1
MAGRRGSSRAVRVGGGLGAPRGRAGPCPRPPRWCHRPNPTGWRAVWRGLVTGAVLVPPDDSGKRSPIHLAAGGAARLQVLQLLGILELLGLLRGDRLQLA